MSFEMICENCGEVFDQEFGQPICPNCGCVQDSDFADIEDPFGLGQEEGV